MKDKDRIAILEAMLVETVKQVLRLEVRIAKLASKLDASNDEVDASSSVLADPEGAAEALGAMLETEGRFTLQSEVCSHCAGTGFVIGVKYSAERDGQSELVSQPCPMC